MEPIYISLIPNVIGSLFKVQTEEDLPYYFNKLSPEVTEMIIENAIISDLQNIDKNRLQRGLILKYFENFFRQFDGTWICWYLLDKDDRVRYLNGDGEWLDGEDDIRAIVMEHKKSLQNQLDNNEYGFYGQVNRGMNKFCIRDVRTKVEKKHKQKSGRVCKTIKRIELVNLASRILKIDGDDQTLNNETNKANLWTRIQSKKDYLKKAIDSGDIELTADSPIEEIRRFIYWGSKNVAELCELIQNWFDRQGLLVEDPGCGKQGRTKI